MFFRYARLPSEDQMLYIFFQNGLYNGGWGRGMGNKSDKVSASQCLSLSRFCSLCSYLADVPFLHSLFISFSPFSLFYRTTIHLQLHFCFIVLLSFRLVLHSMLGSLHNKRPDVLVVKLQLGSVLAQSRITRIAFKYFLTDKMTH